MDNIYHKFIKKSRSSAEHVTRRRIDIFLIVAVLAVLVLIIVNIPLKRANNFGRTDITISPQCEDIFGEEVVVALIWEFEEQYPELRIRTAHAGTSSAESGVLGSHQGADIVFFDDGAFADLLNNSALASLDPYMHAETETGQPIAHWALPMVLFMELFYYNIDILEAANCDRPPKTRAEFLDAARAVAKNNPPLPWQESVSAFALGLSEADPLALRRDLYPWIWADGGEIYTPAAEDGTLSLSRVTRNTLAFMDQLNREGLLAPRSFEKTGAQRLEEFARGRIAMILAPAQHVALLRNNAPDINFGITTVPVTTHGRNRVGLSGIYAGINSECTRPAEAWKFLAFLAEKSQMFAEKLGAVPGSFPIAFPGEYIEKDTYYSKAWDIFEAAEIVDYYPGQPLEAETDRLIREQLMELLSADN